MFRCDQIWFIEKDQNQASKLYPLTDFSPRKDKALEKGYLMGRYGALPLVNNLIFQQQHSEVKMRNIGNESVVMGKVPDDQNVGHRSVVIGPTDSNGNTILNTSMAIGYNAQASKNSIAIGYNAGAGLEINQLITLLQEVKTKTTDQTTVSDIEKLVIAINQPQLNKNFIEKLWECIKEKLLIAGVSFGIDKITSYIQHIIPN